MSPASRTSDFFVAGGTLRPNAPSYIKRPADDELFNLTLAGEFCYILSARQMGKSSLMVRTAQGLRTESVHTAIIDLTEIGAVTAEEWYLGLLTELTRALRLSIDLEAWWQARSSLGYVQRFINFLRDVVLTKIEEQVVIFIDEIDMTLSLDFSDDFFAAVRAMYNNRARDSRFNRLTFVLLGVAAPFDLIKDRTRTPFNIGQGIALNDFSETEAAILKQGLEEIYPGQEEIIFSRIFQWTNGHPYLTQKLCLTVAKNRDNYWSNEQIDRLVTNVFLTEEARKEVNLQFVQDRIINSPYRNQLLTLYRRVCEGEKVPEDEQSLIQNQLKLYGLVRVEHGVLKVRNDIYRYVFDRDWIDQNMPPYFFSNLQQALLRLSQGQTTEADLTILRRALHTGQITLASGEQAVDMGYNTTDTVVVTDDHNVVNVVNSADVYALRQSTWIRLAAGLVSGGLTAIGIIAIVVVVGLLVWQSTTFIPSSTSVVKDTVLLTSPSNGSEPIAHLKREQQVEVLGQIPDTPWLYVETQRGDMGWVRKGYLRNIPDNLPDLPVGAKLYYLIILDASSRMTASFAGNESKWVSARESVLNLLNSSLPTRAAYGLIVLGGNQRGSTQTCDDTNEIVIPLGLDQKQNVIETIESIEPGGVASLTDALALARDELLELPADMEKTIIIITGGGDSCHPDDEWESFRTHSEINLGSVNTWAELIILADEEINEEVLTVTQKIHQLGLENVQAGTSSSKDELESDMEVVVEQAKERARIVEPTAITAAETAVAAVSTTVEVGYDPGSRTITIHPGDVEVQAGRLCKGKMADVGRNAVFLRTAYLEEFGEPTGFLATITHVYPEKGINVTLSDVEVGQYNDTEIDASGAELDYSHCAFNAVQGMRNQLGLPSDLQGFNAPPRWDHGTITIQLSSTPVEFVSKEKSVEPGIFAPSDQANMASRAITFR